MLDDWKPIQFHNGYFVNRLGKIKGKKGFVLKQYPHSKGYLFASLWDNGRRTLMLIHSIVAEAFIGPQSLGHDIHHIDGNKCNNHWDNLQYIPKCDHRKMHHIDHYSGENHGRAKLKNNDIPHIRQLITSGMSLSAIGRLYSVNHATIRDIKNNKTWFNY